jgi:TonB family protein
MKLKRKQHGNLLAAISILLVLIGIPAFGQQSPNNDQPSWHVLAPSDEEFSVLLPGATTNTTKSRTLGSDTKVENAYSYEAGDVHYYLSSIVGLNEVKAGTDKEKVGIYGKILARSIGDAFTKDGQRPAEGEPRDITLDGNPGVEYLSKLDGKSILVMRFYLTKQKFYLVTAVIPTGNLESDRVLHSFTFNRKGPFQTVSRVSRDKPPVVDTPGVATLQADPMLFPPGSDSLNHIDPKSSGEQGGPGKVPNPDKGNGGGIGLGGSGVGNGTGPGVGPGAGASAPASGNRDANGEKIYSPREVTQKARILSKPEPEYTEEASQNHVRGTVVVRAIFSSSGKVTNIRVTSGLPFGLTETAVAAAHKIKFKPAIKDGKPVSTYAQIEYHFH